MADNFNQSILLHRSRRPSQILLYTQPPDPVVTFASTSHSSSSSQPHPALVHHSGKLQPPIISSSSSSSISHRLPISTSIVNNFTIRGYEFRVHIHGHRKCLFYSFCTILSAISLFNCVFSLWLYGVISVSMNGPIQLQARHFRLNGDAYFHRTLQAQRILPHPEQTLQILAPDIQLFTMRPNSSSPNRFASRLRMSSDFLQAQTEQLVITDSQGKLLLMHKPNNFICNVDQLKINDSRPFRLGTSLQTPRLESGHLQLISLSRQIELSAGERLDMSSRTQLNLSSGIGSIWMTSSNSSLVLQSPEVRLPSIRSFLPSTGGSAYPNLYSLCICSDNGRLFMAASHLSCSRAGAMICSVE